MSSRAISPALRFLPLRPVGTARWSGNASEDEEDEPRGRGGASPVRRSEAVVSWSSLKAVVVSWSSLKASLLFYPRSVALASRSHIDHPFNIAIGPLGIWSFSVLQTRKNLGAPRITYVKHRVYAGATKSHNSCFVGQSWIGV